MMRTGWKLLASLLIAGCLGTAGVAEARPARTEPPIPRTDVVIDIGHGGIDGGTSYGEIKEKTLNLEVGMLLYPLLRSKGISAGMTRASDYALSDDNVVRGSRHGRDLSQRVKVANRLNPAMVISLHVNWANNRLKSGPLVIYRKNHAESKRLAQLLQQELNALYGTDAEPVPGKKYFILRHTKPSAVIVEMGYLSNEGDRARLQSRAFQQKVAEAVARGAQAYLRETQPSRFPKP